MGEAVALRLEQTGRHTLTFTASLLAAGLGQCEKCGAFVEQERWASMECPGR
jgi:hypothetical protein